MRSRLLAVWMTYWSRPFVLVMGLFWVAMLVGPLMIGGSTNHVRRSHPEVEMPGSSIERVEQLDAVRQSGRQEDVGGLRLDWLSHKLVRRDATWDEERQSWVASGDPAQMDTLKFVEEFPNLKALTYDNLILLPEDLQRLSRCKQLTQLSLSGVQVYEKRTDPDAVGGRLREFNGDDLVVIAGLKQLEVLDLSGLEIAGNLESLSGLPNLHTLILSRFEHLNDATLADLRHLPSLKTLVITPVYIDRPRTDHDGSVTDTGLSSLAEVSSLQTIFIGFHGPSTVPVAKLQETLPSVWVRRGYYSQERVAIGGWLPILIAIVLTTLLSLHTQMMYAQPSAYLLPRFSPAHQILPCLLLTVTIVGVTSSLSMRDASLFPSLCLAIFWPAVPLWFSCGHGSRGRRGSGFLASLGLVLAVILTIGSIVRFPAEFDAFLLGDTAWAISATLLSVSLMAIVRWTRNLPKLAQGIASTDARAIMSWDDLGINKTLKRQLESGDDSGVDGMYRRSDQFVEQVLRHATSGSGGRLQFWRAGVPRVGLRSAMVAVFMGVIMTHRSWLEVFQSGTLTSDVVTSEIGWVESFSG